MALVLHARKTNKNSYKTLITAEYTGVQVELVQNFEMDVSNKIPEFLTMNPTEKVPVSETPDGPIFESNAITRYGRPYTSVTLRAKLSNGLILLHWRLMPTY